MRGSAAVVVLALAMAGMPTPAHASEPDATELRDQAAQAYVEGRYADASELYRVAFQKDHDAWLLYARAAAEHRGRNYENAIALYSWYVATDPPEDKRKAAESNIAVCRLELVSRAEGKPRPRVEPSPPVEPAPQWWPERDVQRNERPLILDPLGLSLGSVAVMGFVLSAGLAISAKHRSSSEDQRVASMSPVREQRTAVELYTGAGVAVVLASVAALGSAAAYSVAAKKRRERRLALSGGGVRLTF